MPNKTIRVTTYNVHFGRNIEKLTRAFLTNKNLAKTDIVMLQEVEAFPHEGLARAEKIAASLGFICHYVSARPSRRFGRMGTHGLAILSRYPLSEISTIKLPFFKMPWSSRKRIALLAKTIIDGREIYLCNIHLDARINAKARIEQVSGAVRALDKLNGAPIILAGDFNTFPFFMALKMVPILYQNQYKKIHDFLKAKSFLYFTDYKGPSMRRGWLGMKLDHIYTNSLPIVKCGVEKTVTASDHKPVWADIVIDLPAMPKTK